MTRRHRKGSTGNPTNAPMNDSGVHVVINNQPESSGTAFSVCKYFLSGHCKYGNSCRFQHIGNPQSHPPAINPPKQSPKDQNEPQVTLDDVVRFDLSINIPWPFSCYGIVEKWELGGNIIVGDYSQEELRMEAYAQQRTLGNIHNYRQQVEHLKVTVDAQKAAIRANPRFALEEACSRKSLFNPITNTHIPQPTAPLHHPPLIAQHIQQPHLHQNPPQVVQPIETHHHQQQVMHSDLHQQPPSLPPQNIAPLLPVMESPQVFEFGKIPEGLPPKKL